MDLGRTPAAREEELVVERRGLEAHVALEARGAGARAAAAEVEDAQAALDGLLYEQLVHGGVRAELFHALLGAGVVGVEDVAALQREHGREDALAVRDAVQHGAGAV